MNHGRGVAIPPDPPPDEQRIDGAEENRHCAGSQESIQLSEVLDLTSRGVTPAGKNAAEHQSDQNDQRESHGDGGG